MTQNPLPGSIPLGHVCLLGPRFCGPRYPAALRKSARAARIMPVINFAFMFILQVIEKFATQNLRNHALWMIEEKAEHLLRRIRSFGVSVRTMRTAARPGVAGAVHQPVLYDRLPAIAMVFCVGLGMAVRDLAPRNAHARRHSSVGGGTLLSLRRRTLGYIYHHASPF